MKNWEALAHDLNNYNTIEDFQKDSLVDYIACPFVDECDYDGVHEERCVKCKIKWLESEWSDT